ncbi:phenylacetate--CoA ligase [Pseudomaricurvus alkylphenolicus]|uniref:phenylacetate--CoA ligase family protein n=1 Tax=Pseudomaricurvus alkylphenolicus TaxID=1306991 RepID=UPI00141D7D73|nr:AMP-binding protein [Pseudomaricurvus alkylphenolicus]NIB43504.1 phenylacetate--CoA ligase [Pseudomaricurvus alkylphenolicus]
MSKFTQINRDYENLSPGEIRDLQWSKLSAILPKIWEENPYYRKKWEDAGINLSKVNSIEDFAEIMPMVNKADFIQDQEENSPYGLRHDAILKSGIGHVPITTSGTSGQGVELHLQSQEDVSNHGAVNEYYFRWAGLKPGDSVFLMMHVSLLAGGRCEYHAALDYGLSVYPVAMYDTQKRVELMQRFRPKAILATTSYLGYLSAKAGDELKDAGVEKLLCGAEAASPKWFHRLESNYGARAFDRYGLSQMATDHMFSCEYGVGDFDTPGVVHNIDPYILLEVIDPETGQHVSDGERGEIVLTSLYRQMVPMIRCKTNDSAIYRAPRSCKCGRPFSGIQIGSVQRIDEVKKVKGINIWTQAMDEAMFSFSEVHDYQVTLMSDESSADVAVVAFVPTVDLAENESKELADRIIRHLRQRIGIGFQVKLAEGEFERSASQKSRRWIEKRDHVIQSASIAK